MKFKKQSIAFVIFTIAVAYIISPWVLEKMLLFNELLSAIGLGILIGARFRMGSDPISRYMRILLIWCTIHLVTSLFRMDSFYYYLRNSVIFYSMMTFFIGYYCLPYLRAYITGIRRFLRVYIGFFLFVPLSRFLFERFGMAMLFPAAFRKASRTYVPFLLILINIIYGFSYDSLTALILASFYILLFMSPGYKFFKQVCVIAFLSFFALLIYLVPYLDIISLHYSYNDTNAIHEVMRSNPILGIDGNNTWRLVLWKQVIFDDFPGNIFGLGFGTPAIRYFPVEDPHKLATLPYLIGAHNSFIYLFGRLGIVFPLVIIPIYSTIMKEYYYQKAYYTANNRILLFWSFFAITIIALFNPTLESPIYSGAYWLFLGFIARAVMERRSAAATAIPALPGNPPLNLAGS